MTTGPTPNRKRFYAQVTVAAVTSPPGAAPSFRVTLDGRGIRTPAKRELAAPSRGLAEAIAEEWRSQGATIEPATMPLTRLANSTIDGVDGREQEVRDAILAYGGSDHLCYLADGPIELVERQSRRWGEIYAWLKKAFGIELALAVGVTPVKQDAAMLDRLDKALGEPSTFALAALHVVTASTGSLLLALAVLHGKLEPIEAWELAHIDEDFQIERWGQDEEATARRAARWLEMEAACRVLSTVDQ